MNEDQIDKMVNRFLSWPLPKDFFPDGGITFERKVNGQDREGAWWPVGTNLLTAEQARGMIKHMLGDA